MPTTTASHHAAAAISGHLDTRTAGTEVADRLFDSMAGPCHLLMVFGSFHHRAALPDAVALLRQTLQPGITLAVTCESVVGEDQEREGKAGLSAMALRADGAILRPWMISSSSPVDVLDEATFRHHVGAGPDTHAVLVMADPFSAPIRNLLQAMQTGHGDPGAPVIGGVASGASQPGNNVLMLDEMVSNDGAVGVTIGGNLAVDAIVSQGCRPIGQPLVVTKAQDNLLLELGGQPPMAVLKKIALELDEAERALLNKGLLLGVVINEYKDHFGRGDFLVRNVTALDMKRGVIAVADHLNVGQTVQFHVRDAATADEDFQLLLDAQELMDPAFAALLFTCNGRGTRLFSEPDHDLRAVHQRLGDIPVAGFFAAGEIGPIGDRSFLHGHTASVAVLRKRSDEATKRGSDEG